MKTNELIGPALDWAVAKCEDAQPFFVKPVVNNPDGAWLIHTESESESGVDLMPDYSTDWSRGGPIIERESIDCIRDPNGSAGWGARMYKSGIAQWQYGPTPLITAMRCYVASKLGDKVEIPKELL